MTKCGWPDAGRTGRIHLADVCNSEGNGTVAAGQGHGPKGVEIFTLK